MGWLDQGVVHLWLFALVAAAFAPWCVKVFARAIERRVNARTTATIARANTLHASHERRVSDVEHRSTPAHVERVEGDGREGRDGRDEQ